MEIMSFLKIFACPTAAFLLFTAGCGGGGEEAATPEESATEAVEYVKVDPATAGSVSGKVVFDGEAPSNPRINMSAEPDCAELHSAAVRAETAVVGDGGALTNVLVWVKSGIEGKFEVPSTSVSLSQKGCIYTPHVVALQSGQVLSVTNEDPTTHNVHPLPRVNREWNKSQTANASAIERKFSRQEIMLPVKCNIHPWMRSYINVIDHPFFAVTAADGSFEIKGLPPGTYTIEAQHEKFDAQEMSVTVGASESKQADFTFSAG
jgi:plastocyanin